MAPFTWQAGSNGFCEATIHGLKVAIAGQLFDAEAKSWVPIGLFNLKPAGCTLNLSVTEADIGGLEWGIRKTRGRIIINGAALK